MTNTHIVNETHDDKVKWFSMVGQQVEKYSKKPFQSGEKVGLVIGVCQHPITNRTAFRIDTHDNIVECRTCRKVVVYD